MSQELRVWQAKESEKQRAHEKELTLMAEETQREIAKILALQTSEITKQAAHVGTQTGLLGKSVWVAAFAALVAASALLVNILRQL